MKWVAYYLQKLDSSDELGLIEAGDMTQETSKETGK